MRHLFTSSSASREVMSRGGKLFILPLIMDNRGRRDSRFRRTGDFGVVGVVAEIVIHLEPDVAAQLDIEQLVQHLNRVCHHLHFCVGELESFTSELDLRDLEEIPIIVGHNWKRGIREELLREASQSNVQIFVSLKLFDDLYFLHGDTTSAMVSFYGWPYLSGLPISNGLVYFLLDLLALDLDDSYRHQDTTGCIYDFLAQKASVDAGMRFGGFCPLCLMRLARLELSERNAAIFTDLRQLMNDLSNASKWDQDVLRFWEDRTRTPPAADVSRSQFLPETDEQGYLNVSRPYIDRLCSAFAEISRDGLSSNEKGAAFEVFAKEFFGLIKGWTLLDQDVRLTDCEIDLMYDISAGPKVLSGRLGDNIFVECKFTAERATVRDVSHFIENLKTRHLKGGIFFSYNGLTGYRPDDWRQAGDAYQRILTAYTQDGRYVLPLVAQDIEAVRSGANLVAHLQDLINRFIRI